MSIQNNYQTSSFYRMGFPKAGRYVGWAFMAIVAFIALSGIVWYRMELPSLPTAFAKTAQIVGIFCFVGFVFYLMEQMWPEDAHQNVTPKEGAINTFLMVINHGIMPRIVASIVGSAAMILTMANLPRLSSDWITFQPAWAQAFEIAIIKDFLGYWNHRAFHEIPWLWRFHAIHHSSEDVFWLSAAREHPFEQILTKLVTLLPLYLLGFSLTVLGPYVVLWFIYLMFLHSNTKFSYGPFRYLFVSPAFHRWHHTNEEHLIDRNYATLLPIWDYIFGTAYHPLNEYSKSYGLIGGEKMPPDFKTQFFYPFHRGKVGVQEDKEV